MESKPLPPDVPNLDPEILRAIDALMTECVQDLVESAKTGTPRTHALDARASLHRLLEARGANIAPQPHEDFASYQREAHKTAGTMPERDRVFMASMGLAGEAGEVVDELKKVHFHAKPYERAKLVRELGDVLWYLAELATTLGIDLQEVAFENLAKLRARHGGEGFKPHAEQRRDEPATITVVGNCGAMQVPAGPPTAVVHGDCILSSPDASSVERGRCYVQGDRELREVHRLLTRLGATSQGSARERLFYLIRDRGWRPNVASPWGDDTVSTLAEAKAPSPLEVKGTPTPPAFAASAIRDGFFDPAEVTIDGHKLVDVVNFLRHARPFFLNALKYRQPQNPDVHDPVNDNAVVSVRVGVWDAIANAAALLFPSETKPERPHFEQPGER